MKNKKYFSQCSGISRSRIFDYAPCSFYFWHIHSKHDFRIVKIIITFFFFFFFLLFFPSFYSIIFILFDFIFGFSQYFVPINNQKNLDHAVGLMDVMKHTSTLRIYLKEPETQLQHKGKEKGGRQELYDTAVSYQLQWEMNMLLLKLIPSHTPPPPLSPPPPCPHSPIPTIQHRTRGS